MEVLKVSAEESRKRVEAFKGELLRQGLRPVVLFFNVTKEAASLISKTLTENLRYEYGSVVKSCDLVMYDGADFGVGCYTYRNVVCEGEKVGVVEEAHYLYHDDKVIRVECTFWLNGIERHNFRDCAKAFYDKYNEHNYEHWFSNYSGLGSNEWECQTWCINLNHWKPMEEQHG